QAASGRSQPAETQPVRESCAFHGFRVGSVSPYRVDQNMGGHFVVQRVLGAELFVPAEPGLTAEWLWASLRRHVAGMKGQAMTDCPLCVDKLQVEVAPAGPGFRVRLIAPDAKSAQEVLRRARLLAT